MKVIKNIWILMMLISFLTACGKRLGGPLESDFYWLDSDKCAEVFKELKKTAYNDMGGMTERGEGDRNKQKQALSRIAEHGIYAMPFLITVLELGNPYHREVAKEGLLNLAEGQSKVYLVEGNEAKGAHIADNRDILAGRFLIKMEQEYKYLTNNAWRNAKMVAHNRYPDPVKVRQRYRMNLCELMSKICDGKYIDRLLLSVEDVDRDSPVVRAACYKAVGEIGGVEAIGRLIGVYQTEASEDAKHAIWQSLLKLTGEDFPNYPKVWKVWAKRKGIKYE